MKKRIALCLLLMLCATLFAGTAPERFELQNHIPVYFKHNAESELTAVYVVVRGGVQTLTPQTSGLEDAVFSLMRMGSKNRSFQELQDFCYRTQSEFFNYSIHEGSVLGMTCITDYFDDTFFCLEDAFLNPLFSEREYGLLMQEYRQNIQSIMNEPAQMLMYYASLMLYDGHPYAAKTSATPESIENITLAAIKKHYRSLLDARRLCIVASGNVSAEHLQERLEKAFGSIPALSSPLAESGVPSVSVEGENAVLVHQSAAGTGYVLRAFASPAVTDEDYAAACITAAIYTDILHNVVREKHGACYTPYSFVSSSAAPLGGDVLYRASNLTEFASFMDEAKEIMLSGMTISARKPDGSYVLEPVSARLEGYINSYITGKFVSQATVGGVTGRMCASLLQFGDILRADGLIEKARSLTPADVDRVFRAYWVDGASRWFAVVGPDDEENVKF